MLIPAEPELVPLCCVRNSKRCYETTDQVGLFEKNKRGISSCQFMSSFWISIYLFFLTFLINLLYGHKNSNKNITNNNKNVFSVHL